MPEADFGICVDELDDPHLLVRRDPLRDERHHVLSCEVGAVLLAHHERLRHLLTVGVAHADDRGVGDLVVRQEQRLELGGRHLVALVLDQLLHPVDDREDTLVGDGGDVARVQVALVVEGDRGGLGVVEVAGHHVRALDPQLAALAGPDFPAGLRVDELALDVGEGARRSC